MAEQEEKDTDFIYKGLFNASSQDASVVQSDKQGMTASGTDRRNPQRWLSICALVIAAGALIVAVAIAISYKPDCSCHMHETPDSGIIQNFYPPLGEVLAVTRVLLLFVCPAGLECSICVSESVSEATDWSVVWEELRLRCARRLFAVLIYTVTGCPSMTSISLFMLQKPSTVCNISCSSRSRISIRTSAIGLNCNPDISYRP